MNLKNDKRGEARFINVKRGVSSLQKVTIIAMVTVLVVGISFLQTNAKTREAIVRSMVPVVLKDGTVAQMITFAKRIKNEDISSNAKIAYKKLDLDGQIQADDLKDGVLTATKLEDGSITSVKIEDGAIVSGKIMDGAVVSVKIADGAVSTAKVENGAITNIKLALVLILIQQVL